MNLDKFDGKCVRVITASGEVFEGIVFFKNDILSVTSLEDVNGPLGHYSEKYGLLEKMCLEWGTDMIEEVLDTEDSSQILRMLACMKDNFQTLLDRGVPGLAPWRRGMSISKSEDDENEQGPVYLGELENMLRTLVKYNEDKEVVKEAKGLLEQLAAFTD